MLRQTKEAIASASRRTKKILGVMWICLVIMVSTVTAQALEDVKFYQPTIDIQLKDGASVTKQYLVKKDTVNHVLDELNIDLNQKDTVNKGLNDVVNEDDLIQITRITTKKVIKKESISYKTVVKGKGGWTKTPINTGKKGILEKTYSLTYRNDKQISSQLIKKQVVKKPVNKVYKKGKSIKKGTLFTGRLTTYGGDCRGCSGKSASGAKLSAKTGVNNSKTPFLKYKGKKYYCLAADRSIPFGTIIKISNHNLKTKKVIYGIVVDRGGAIKKNKIDIFKGSERSSKGYFRGGTSYKTKFEIISKGNGKAYFWKR
jgi:3D (Asp-Asp-Asp) domain-containing protein